MSHIILNLSLYGIFCVPNILETFSGIFLCKIIKLQDASLFMVLFHFYVGQWPSYFLVSNCAPYTQLRYAELLKSW